MGRCSISPGSTPSPLTALIVLLVQVVVMPVSVQCPACGRTHQAGEEMYGRRAQCPCGGVVEIPVPSAANPTAAYPTSSSPPAAHPNASQAASPAAAVPAKKGIPVVCPSCRTQHQADFALAGRSVQCRCGGVLTVPFPNRSGAGASPAVAASTSVLDELSASEMQSTAYSPYGYPPAAYGPPGYGPPGYGPPGYGPPGYAPPGYAPPGYAPQAGNAPQRKRSEAEVLSGYLEDESWRAPDQYSKNDDGGLFSFESGILNSGVIGGLIAMLVGIVGFFVPMMFGVWFPYLGILFILGVIGVVRGLLTGR